MACFKKKTVEEEESAAKSKRIERQLRADRARTLDPIKLLLLGTGASGKSTFLKQLKMIHKEGFSQTEIDQYRETLPLNALLAMQRLLRALFDVEKKIPPKKKSAAEVLLSATEVDEDLASQIKDLWLLDEVKELYDLRTDLGIQVDSAAPYYFENVDRFVKSSFVPTAEDMIRARVKTTGIREVRFEIKSREFVIVDVGGQRSERRKWIHCFDNVNAIIYLAAVDEYDMKLEEDSRTNCMEESLQLFTEISGSQFFSGRDMAWILFLNKTDLLKEKIKTKPLNLYYKDFPASKSQDFNASLAFLQEKFEKKYRGASTPLYVYNTCAIDTKNCEKVFEAVNDMVASSAIEEVFGV